jgi:Ca2+-binding RTX toxin-like protein/endo-alpha-1,4-polygalactosaminidase (GH114 family)
MPRISSYALQYSNVVFSAIQSSSFDLFITEGAPFTGTRAITDAQVATLRGEGRLVLAYVNVAVTDDTRYYWSPTWTSNTHDTGTPDGDAPAWLQGATPLDFNGDHVQDALIVRFGDPDWQNIVIAQAVELVNRGYSGVFLDDVGAYDLTYNDADRQDPAILAIIGQNALAMAKLVAAVAAAIGPNAQVYVNVDPYMTNYIPNTAEGNAAKAAYFAAVDGYLFENPTVAYLDAGHINLPDVPFLVLKSRPGISDEDAWARGTLYIAPNSAFNSLGTSAYPSTQGNDVLAGGDGPNQIHGLGGNDLLSSGSGNDRLYGDDGSDVLYFGGAFTGLDLADGGAGRDAIVLQGNYVLTLSATNLVGIESISLQSGANAAFGDTANNFYDFNLTTANGNVPAGQQLIVNAQSLRAGEDFTFNGSAETDGTFLVYGGHGVDNLTGGTGGDVFFFEGSRWGPGDQVNGGPGGDSLVISAGSGLAHIEFGATSLTNIESISLNKQFASDPTQKPSYELVLNNGNVAAGGTLIVNGFSLVDPVQIVGIDGRAIQGGNLILFGGAGHDTLQAGSGADILMGAGRADSLTGGAGADIFRYDSTADSTAATPDLIGDFQTGSDKIDLSRIDANTIAAGDQAFTWIGANAFSGAGAASAGQLRVFADGGYQRIEGDTNGDGVADLVIVLQVGTAPPVQSDFLL